MQLTGVKNALEGCAVPAKTAFYTLDMLHRGGFVPASRARFVQASSTPRKIFTAISKQSRGGDCLGDFPIGIRIMESFRTAFDFTTQSLSAFLNIIVSSINSVASFFSGVIALLLRSAAFIASVPRLVLDWIAPKFRSASCLGALQSINLRKLRNYKFWTMLIACLTLLLAGFAFWVSFASLRYSEWTARKEFTLLCRDEVTYYQ